MLGGLAAVILVGWGLRDLLAPVRLAVDATGVTVPAGMLSRRHLPWPTVENIQLHRRSGRGLAGPTLEIDTGDSLHLFSRLDLGTDPAEVADALRAARARVPAAPADPLRATRAGDVGRRCCPVPPARCRAASAQQRGGANQGHPEQ